MAVTAVGFGCGSGIPHSRTVVTSDQAQARCDCSACGERAALGLGNGYLGVSASNFLHL